MASGAECDAAEQAYEVAEQAYFAAVRSGAAPVLMAQRAAELRELADNWSKQTYAWFFVRRDQGDEHARDTEVEAEIAEMLEGLWRALAEAHRSATEP